jgi:putative restriction endonuclease
MAWSSPVTQLCAVKYKSRRALLVGKPEPSNPVHLVASHCKPWRDSSNAERLNGENGLLLTPSIDHLFDRGFIGFENDGKLIVSPVAHRPSLERMGIDVRGEVNVGSFTAGQRGFLEFHRDMVLLKRAR